MLISVTSDDIRDGFADILFVGGDPVERAICRHTGAKLACVSRKRIDIDFVGRARVRVPVPEIVRDWIDRLEDLQPVEPFSFDLEVTHAR